MKGTLSVYGAFDRINYGDLLFPLVVKHCVLRMNLPVELRYYTTVDSDLRTYGGVQTRSIRRLQGDLNIARKTAGRQVLVVAGGEVLSATWGSVIGSLLPNDFVARVERSLRARIGEDLFSKLYGRIFNVASPLPFVLADNDYPDVQVVYNAVGGSHLDFAPESVRRESFERLKRSAYVSVRDQKTKDIVSEGIGRPVELSPDSAVILSDMFPIAEISGRLSKSVRALVSSKERYICFQSSNNAAKSHDDLIVDQLLSVCRTHKVKCVSFDIGTAPGHSDQLVVQRMAARPELAKLCSFISCETMFDVMSVIGNSALYCGTSLHGAITGISYGRPVVGLRPDRIPKLKEFLISWGLPGAYRLTEYNGLGEAVGALMNDSRNEPSRAQHLDSLKGRVYKNFEQMLRMFK